MNSYILLLNSTKTNPRNLEDILSYRPFTGEASLASSPRPRQKRPKWVWPPSQKGYMYIDTEENSFEAKKVPNIFSSRRPAVLKAARK